MILQDSIEPFEHFSGLLNCDFDPAEFFDLLRFKFFLHPVTEFATAQADNAQLVQNIVGEALCG